MKKIKTSFVFLLIILMLLMNVSPARAAAVTWTQTDWSGGWGQATWSATNKFNLSGQDGIGWNASGKAKMQIAADVVVGQADMASNAGGGSATNAIVVNNKLIVAEDANNRVLIYNTIPIANNASADVVIGQTNFTDHLANQGGSVAANTLNHPYDIASDGTKLFVADYTNHRVLIYNTIPIANNASADVVIGQPNMTSNASNNGGISAARLRSPVGVFSDGVKLYIVDNGNHRVLIFNTVPVLNNISANVVVGQANFSAKNANQGGSVGANTLANPFRVSVSLTKLFISDADNSRVLIYNTIPIANNASADVAVGQPDLVSSSGSTTANGLSWPDGVYAEGTKLFISDSMNNRVLIYNTIPIANNASADVVIGQPDFLHCGTNQDFSLINCWDSTTTPSASNNINGSSGIFANGGKIYLADYFNNRVLIYNFSSPHSSTLTSSTYDAGTSYVWGPLTYTATTPANTSVSFEVSTDGGGTWEAVTDYTTQTFGPSNTVAYRATLSNTDGTSTPTLTSVSLSGNLAPSVTTSSASFISRTGVTLNGEITATGGTDATVRGFEYGLITSYGTIIPQSSGSYSTGVFASNITSLSCGTTYHYRAYATNLAGTGYGSDNNFIAAACSHSGGYVGGVSSATPSSLPITPIPVSLCSITKNLKLGSRGDEVKCLQTKLNILSDGMFGKQTKAIVIKFQLKNNLTGDGVVGPKTREILNK